MALKVCPMMAGLFIWTGEYPDTGFALTFADRKIKQAQYKSVCINN